MSLEDHLTALKSSFYKHAKIDPIIYSVPIIANLADTIQTYYYLRGSPEGELGSLPYMIMASCGVGAGLGIKFILENAAMATSYIAANYLDNYKNNSDKNWEIGMRKILSPIARYGMLSYLTVSHTIGAISPHVNIVPVNTIFNQYFDFMKLFWPS